MTDGEILDWLAGYCRPGEAGCMIWAGATSGSNGGEFRLPAVRHPVLRVNLPARRVLMMAMGKRIDGKCCTTTCGNPLCMSPEHAIALTRAELQKRSCAVFVGDVRRNAKLAQAARKRSTLTEADVREIRTSGLTAKAAAEKWGIQLQRAAKILRGQSWKEYGANPFLGLMP